VRIKSEAKRLKGEAKGTKKENNED